MAYKLITQIKRELEKNPPEDLEIKEFKQLPNGLYYDCHRKNFRFCLVLQDQAAGVRANWIFHRDLTKDEVEYWQGTYEFKLRDENRVTKSTLEIKDIHNKDEIRVLMSRIVPTLRVFTKDMRWVLKMAKQDEYDWEELL